MAVMKQAILGLHSSRGSTSQVKRTSKSVHGPESHLRTFATQDTSSHTTHRPKPTIFVSWWDDNHVHGRLVFSIYYCQSEESFDYKFVQRAAKKVIVKSGNWLKLLVISKINIKLLCFFYIKLISDTLEMTSEFAFLKRLRGSVFK